VSNPKWEVGPVKLGNGEEAFIDAINEGQEDWRYTGRIRNSRGIWGAAGWQTNGRYMYPQNEHWFDLAPPPKETMRVKVWIIVYESGFHDLRYSRKAALAGGEHARFALIEIDREVTKGEVLSEGKVLVNEPL
jgi:hypothetical protein